MYAEQCLNGVHLLDLDGELLWVGTFYCARNPTFAIITLLHSVNLHRFFPLSSHFLVAFLRPCFCSLLASFKKSPRCRTTKSSNSLCVLPFMMPYFIRVLPLRSNGLSQNVSFFNVFRNLGQNFGRVGKKDATFVSLSNLFQTVFSD